MPPSDPLPVYEFSGCRLDCERFELLRNGLALRVERKPMELLILLVSRQGKLVTRAEISERLWSSEVFVDTEHGINTAIRKLRQLLRDDSEEPQFIQTVTGMGYRFVATVVTVVPSSPEKDHIALGELPAEIATDSTASREISPSHSRRLYWIMFAAIAVLLIAALTIPFAGNTLTGRLAFRRARPKITSIAVLPLSNFSGDPSQDYFADGMTDELITMLAKDSTLSITSHTSVMRYKGSRRPLREIANALHVDGIVEGSVSRSEKKVHLTLQLIRADSDTHIWAESYDRDLNDVPSLPEDAAQSIASRLNSLSTIHGATLYIDPEAHDAYLRGHYFWTVGRNEEAGKFYRRAVEIQPDYAAGWAGLSQYYSAGVYSGIMEPFEALPQAKAAGQKAVQLDDNLPQAHSVMAAAVFFNDWDGPHALQEVTRATELDPHFAEAFHLHALILAAMGRSQEAMAVQRQSTAIDPIAHPAAMAEILLYTGQCESALDEAQMRLRDFPDAEDLMTMLIEIYHCKGMDRESAEMLAKLEGRRKGKAHPETEVLNAFKSGGFRQVLRWRLAKLEQTAKTRYVSSANIAHIYAELGEHDKALALLDQAFLKHDPWLLFIQIDPAFNFLHSDPRYSALLKKIERYPSN